MLVLTILVRKWVVVSVEILSHALINHAIRGHLGVYQGMGNCVSSLKECWILLMVKQTDLS